MIYFLAISVLMDKAEDYRARAAYYSLRPNGQSTADLFTRMAEQIEEAAETLS